MDIFIDIALPFFLFIFWLLEILRRREAERQVKFWQDLQAGSQNMASIAIKGWNEAIEKMELMMDEKDRAERDTK